MDAVSVNAPIPIVSGYHIRCGSTLPTIASDRSVCEPPTSVGVWQDALDGHEWDALVVQPFLGGVATIETDTASIETFVNELHKRPANLDTKVYLYQSWPFQTGETWSDWLAPATFETRHRQSYYQALKARLQQEGIVAEVIPNADVLYYVINNLNEFGAVGSASSIYRDDIHLSSLGSFLVGMTTLSYLNGADLSALSSTPYSLPLPENQQDELHSAIWRIVNAVQNPGDLNADGAVNVADYNQWKAAYGDWQAGVDVNLDSKIDAADYTVWRDKRDALFPLAAGQSLPEPRGVVLVTVALSLLYGADRGWFQRIEQRSRFAA